MDKKNVLWFSRHQPTPEQLSEIASHGWQIAGIDDGIKLGAMNLMDDGDVHAVGYGTAVPCGGALRGRHHRRVDGAHAGAACPHGAGCRADRRLARRVLLTPRGTSRGPSRAASRCLSTGGSARSEDSAPPRCGGRNRRYTITPLPAGMATRPRARLPTCTGFSRFAECAESLESDTGFDTYALDRIKPVSVAHAGNGLLMVRATGLETLAVFASHLV